MMGTSTLCSLLVLAASLLGFVQAQDNIVLQPEHVFVQDQKPGFAACKILNVDDQPFFWSGVTWYDPSGNLLPRISPNIIVETQYVPPSARSKDFWYSTLYLNPKDYGLSGDYVCRVDYNGVVTSKTVSMSVKACKSDEFTCPGSGNCIPCNLVCNNDNDCGDWGDEFQCNTPSSPLISSPTCS